MNDIRLVCLLLICSLVLSGCAVLGGSPSERNAVDYGLGPGDKIRIVVFGEPELSGEFSVDKSGQISLPLLGNVASQGLAIDQLEMSIANKLSESLFDDPRVSAEVVAYRPVFILGEVNAPGRIQFEDGLTAFQAIATAGGFTYRANKKLILIQSSADEAESRYKLTSQTPLKPGDTVRIVERGVF